VSIKGAEHIEPIAVKRTIDSSARRSYAEELCSDHRSNQLSRPSDIPAGTRDNRRSNYEPWLSLRKLDKTKMSIGPDTTLPVFTCVASPYISCDTRDGHIASFRHIGLACSTDSLQDVYPTRSHDLFSDRCSTNIAKEAYR
jgi:hypothetical protein